MINKFLITFEKEGFNSYGIKTGLSVLSFGTHLYNNFFSLLPKDCFKNRTPGFIIIIIYDNVFKLFFMLLLLILHLIHLHLLFLTLLIMPLLPLLLLLMRFFLHLKIQGHLAKVILTQVQTPHLVRQS